MTNYCVTGAQLESRSCGFVASLLIVCLLPTMTDSTSPIPHILATPVKHGTSTMHRFTTNHKYQQKEMLDMGNEMRKYFLGPIPATKFLNTFFPLNLLETSLKAKTFQPGCFSEVTSCTCETDAYIPFVV